MTEIHFITYVQVEFLVGSVVQWTNEERVIRNRLYAIVLGVISSFFIYFTDIKSHTTDSESGFFPAPSFLITITMKKTAKEHRRATMVMHHPNLIFVTAMGDKTVPIEDRMFRTKFGSATTEAPTPVWNPQGRA